MPVPKIVKRETHTCITADNLASDYLCVLKIRYEQQHATITIYLAFIRVGRVQIDKIDN